MVEIQRDRAGHLTREIEYEGSLIIYRLAVLVIALPNPHGAVMLAARCGADSQE